MCPPVLRHNPKEHSLSFATNLDSIRCPVCGIVQFCTLSAVCKRCHRPLGISYATLILSHNRRPEELARALGHMMRTMRLDRHMTQAECAMCLCTSRSQLSRIENGRLNPSFSILFRAARLFDLDRAIFRMRIPNFSGKSQKEVAPGAPGSAFSRRNVG
jgi:DNA-binding XRE family transcriptional regulator